MGNAISIFITVVSMVAIALIVWKVVNYRESKDPKFQQKLKADDERARKGRASRGQ